MNKIRGTLATFIAFALILALAAPAMATILYDENGKTGTVYLYYDATGSDKWGGLRFYG